MVARPRRDRHDPQDHAKPVLRVQRPRYVAAALTLAGDDVPRSCTPHRKTSSRSSCPSRSSPAGRARANRAGAALINLRPSDWRPAHSTRAAAGRRSASAGPQRWSKSWPTATRWRFAADRATTPLRDAATASRDRLVLVAPRDGRGLEGRSKGARGGPTASPDARSRHPAAGGDAASGGPDTASRSPSAARPQLPFMTLRATTGFEAPYVFAGRQRRKGVYCHPRHNWLPQRRTTTRRE